MNSSSDWFPVLLQGGQVNKPLVLIHALRLYEGKTRTLNGNFFHMRFLLESLLKHREFEFKVLADDVGYESLRSVVPSDCLEHVRLDRGVVSADRMIVSFCRKIRPALYHRPTGQLPFQSVGCRTIAGIADLNFAVLPMPLLRRFYKELSYRWTARRADRIICVSEFTRRHAAAYLRVDPAKMDVIHHGTNRLPGPVFTLAEQVGSPYWLAFGHQEHKNVEVCLKAVAARLADRRLNREKLVVIGESSHIQNVLRPTVAQMGLGDIVRFVGRVSSAELNGLFVRALGLLFPTRFEGFGLPVLEAMSAGCPVISSNVCSLPEVAGQAAIMVHPDDVEAITRGMMALTAGDAVRLRLIDLGRARAAMFSWERAASTTIAVYHKVLEGRRN